MIRGGAVYIITNKNKTTLYTGVTSDLKRRILEHKQHIHKGSFSDRYNLEYLVYYETFPFIDEAIAREKQLKAGNRKRKEELINSMNPEWKDLFDEIKDWQ
jgi:putative endonuclease